MKFNLSNNLGCPFPFLSTQDSCHRTVMLVGLASQAHIESSGIFLNLKKAGITSRKQNKSK